MSSRSIDIINIRGESHIDFRMQTRQPTPSPAAPPPLVICVIPRILTKSIVITGPFLEIKGSVRIILKGQSCALLKT